MVILQWQQQQWRHRLDTLALSFWNHATTIIGKPPTSSTTATQPTEPPSGAQDRTTLRRGRPPDPTKQQAFWFDSDLAFGYLQSDKFPPASDDGQLPKQRGRPPDDEQSHRQRSRTPDDEQLPKHRGRPPGDEQSHELRGWISKILGRTTLRCYY